MIETIKNELKHIPFIIVVTILLYALGVFATTIFQASDVDYDNTNSGIVADQVQGAVDELYQCSVNYKDFSTSVSTPEGKVAGTLNTTAVTIIGAINEIESKFENGALRITYGGTRATKPADARTNLGMASLSDVPAKAISTGSVSGINYAIMSYGKVITVRLYGTTTAAIAADTVLINVPDGKRPSTTIFLPLFSDQNGDVHQDLIRVNITTTGNVANKLAISKDKQVFGSISYITSQ